MPAKQLKRTLSLAECIFFGVGAILGAGIYALIGKVAGEGGNMTWFAFVIASFIALLTAFSYAELSSEWPEAGGEYIYAGKAFGISMGNIAGSMVLLTGIISGSAVALGFAGYFSELININPYVSSVGIIFLVFLINVIGIRLSSVVNVIFTSIEVAGLVFIVYAAFNTLGDVNYFELPDKGINGLLAASALSFFAFLGFEKIVKLAEETKNAEKNIRRALFISSGIVVVVYAVVSIAAVSAIPYNKLAASDSPLSEVAGIRFGAAGVMFIAIVALFATTNTILSAMLGTSRVLLEMAEKISILKPLSAISSRQTPIAALILILLLTVAGTFIGNIEMVAQITNVFMFITFLFVNAAVIALRMKKSYKPKYKVPLNIHNIPVPSVAGIIFTLVMLIYSLKDIFSE